MFSKSASLQIRLEARRPREQNGSILYCTTGILLRWMLGDRSLARVSHIVLDEVHERDLTSDFLLVLVRDLLQSRPDLKVHYNCKSFSYKENCFAEE